MVYGITKLPASRLPIPFPLSRKLCWANKKRRRRRRRACESCSVKGSLPCLNCYRKSQYQSDTGKKPKLIAKSPASRLPLPFPLSRELFWAKARSTRRKRPCEYCIVKGWLPCLNCFRKYQYQSDTHISKKPRLSDTLVLGNSSRRSAFALSQSPESSLRPRRGVDAPSWKSVFGNKSNFDKDQQRDSLGERTSCIMGNAKSILSGAASYLRIGNKAAGVKSNADVEIIYDDSSVEVIDITEDAPEDESVFPHQGLQATDGFVYGLKDLGGMVDEGVIPGSYTVSSDMNKRDDYARLINNLSVGRKRNIDCKKLLECARRSDSKLKELQYDISLQDGILQSFNFLPPVKKQVEEDSAYSVLLKESFVPLSKEESNLVINALSNAYRQKVWYTHEGSNIEITGQILQCLRPGAWLNDEVINVYLELLKEREKRVPKKLLKCHFFNTFFYKKLTGGSNGYDYNSVRRWTSQRKLGYSLIECDKIFVPIHQESHWCLAVIDIKEKKFQYLDSLGGRDLQALNVVAQYMVDEVKDKNGQDFGLSSWRGEFVVDLPAQLNGSDCGVFMIKYIDFYSRGLGLHFRQENMNYFRLKTAKEILQRRAD